MVMMMSRLTIMVVRVGLLVLRGGVPVLFFFFPSYGKMRSCLIIIKSYKDDEMEWHTYINGIILLPFAFAPQLDRASLRYETHEGSLEKLSFPGKKWQRRWFVLKDGVLTYYSDREEARRQTARECDGAHLISTTKYVS